MANGASSDRLFSVSGLKAPCRMLVLGIGDGGGRSVVRMTESWDAGPDVAFINTDAKSLSSCPVGHCLAIGEKTTRRFGAAGDTTAGRLAAEEHAEAIQELVARYDFIFLVGGLGGGTATGAMPVISQIARTAGVLTLCFVTLPFKFEGDRRRLAAEEGLRALQQTADTVVALPNDRLEELADPNQPVESAFRVTDEIVASGIHGLWRLLTQNGVINLNFADVRELFERSGGACGYGHAEARGPARAADALRQLLDSPLLAKGRRISEALGVLISITGGADLTLADVQGIMGRIQAMSRAGAKLFFGAIVDPAWRDRISITVLVTEHWLEDREGNIPARDTLHGLQLETAGLRADAPAKGDADAPEQTEIPFDTAGKGRFEKVEPTYYKGDDLDIPTYIRRGLKLSFEH